jgi:hypothetical protein
MVNVQVGPDCGNAPKKRVLRDFSIAFARHDKSAVLAAVVDDVEWRIIGDRDVTGIEAFGDALDDAWSATVHRLSVETILTHGAQGSVSGSLLLAGSKTLHFCDVYTFTSHSKSAKIARITSYWLR